MIQIDDCIVSADILTEFFACDYGVCKGACCVIGDSGAPLEDCEPGALEENYPCYSQLMSAKGRETVEKCGFAVVDRDGDLVTPLVPHTEECAYSGFDREGNCFCTVERCWMRGNGTFRKPISCWLYPIRVSQLGSGMRALNLHRWDICKCAFEKGRREHVRVYEFLKDPIIRYFGEEFYDMLESAASSLFAAK